MILYTDKLLAELKRRISNSAPQKNFQVRLREEFLSRCLYPGVREKNFQPRPQRRISKQGLGMEMLAAEQTNRAPKSSGEPRKRNKF
jgi:hypothetical protein